MTAFCEEKERKAICFLHVFFEPGGSHETDGPG